VALTVRIAIAVLALVAARSTTRGEQGPPATAVRYEHRTTAEPESIHVLEIEPRRARIVAARALGEGLGRETVSSIAERRGALAAVNAGFFTIGGRYDGEPDGILKVGADWLSDAVLPRAAIGWNENGIDVQTGQVTVRWTVHVEGRAWPVDGINRLRSSAERIVYTWPFHRSTLTDPRGTEVAVARNRVLSVRDGGDSPIPMDGFVYSIGPDVAERGRFRRGQRVRLSRELEVAGAAEERARWEGWTTSSAE